MLQQSLMELQSEQSSDAEGDEREDYLMNAMIIHTKKRPIKSKAKVQPTL